MAYSGRFSTLSRALSTSSLRLLPDPSVYAAPVPTAQHVLSPTHHPLPNPAFFRLVEYHTIHYSTRVSYNETQNLEFM